MFRPSSEPSSPRSMQHASNVLLFIHSRAAVRTAGISILGAFAKLRKATVSFVICLTTWNNSDPTGRIFREI
jgi:hypothetical protein